MSYNAIAVGAGLLLLLSAVFIGAEPMDYANSSDAQLTQVANTAQNIKNQGFDFIGAMFSTSGAKVSALVAGIGLILFAWKMDTFKMIAQIVFAVFGVYLVLSSLGIVEFVGSRIGG